MKIKKGVSIFLLGLSLLSIRAQQNELESKVNSLVSKMTLKEKIGQMNQQSYWGTKVDDIEQYREAIKEGKVGSLLNIVDTETINAAQKIAVEESRLGIPLIIGRDVIHGFKTIFPIPLGQAASFDPRVVETGARVAAIESRERGITWTFAPMIDISRDPRWGRIAESFGEDPFLTGKLGVAMIRGFQGNDLSSPTSVAACIKHFAGYGASEGGRDYNSTHIPPYQMRNVYLEPFRETVKAGAATLMTSFNDNDGIPASGNEFLLKEVLRKEWSFDGIVVSDWASMAEMITHGYAKDLKHVAEIAANAGTDMEMVSEAYIGNLEELVNEGKVSEASIDEAVKNILRTKFRLGLFDNPYIPLNIKSSAYSDSHMDAARDAAVKSAVLLKNENSVLPLHRDQKIAVIGPMANAPHEQLGTWVFDAEKEHTITPVNTLETEYSDVNYIYEPGLKYSRDTDTLDFSKVISAINSSDVAVIFVGEEAILSGEAHSLSDINLVGAQSDLIKVAKSTGKPVVVVIMAGRPLTIGRDLPYADAVLFNFHPGTMGGPAIWDLLYGKANPSGKLPVTFVNEIGQIPIYYNHNNTGRPAVEDVNILGQDELETEQTSVGNKSMYLNSGYEPLFPFGFGLSYSTFEYSDLKLSSNTIPLGGKMKAIVRLTNTSNVEGTEVVQLYIRDLVGSIVRPVKELKGFQKITLKGGESKLVEFEITTDDLAFYGKDSVKKTEPGDFYLWIGGSSNPEHRAEFTVIE